MSHHCRRKTSTCHSLFVLAVVFATGNHLFGNKLTDAKTINVTLNRDGDFIGFPETDIRLDGVSDVKNVHVTKEFSDDPFTGRPAESPFQYIWLVKFNAWYQGVHGYLSLVVCGFGICSNIINILVLTRPIMVSPTNILLTIVACTDILTMVSYLPYAVYFYCYSVLEKGKGHSRSWIVFMIFHNKFVITCHTAAMWLTVLLAVFRYVVVSKPHFFLSHGARTKGRRRSTLTPHWWRVVRLSVLGVLGTTVLFCAPFYVLHKPVSLDGDNENVFDMIGQAVPYGGYTGVGGGPGEYAGTGRGVNVYDDDVNENKSRRIIKNDAHGNHWSKKYKSSDHGSNTSHRSLSFAQLASKDLKLTFSNGDHYSTSDDQRSLGYWIAVNDFIPDEVMTFNFWLFGVLLKLAPCCLLSILSFLLVKTMRRANQKRRRLKQQRQNKQRQQPGLGDEKNEYFCSNSSCCNCYCCCRNKWCYCCCGISLMRRSVGDRCARNKKYCHVSDDKEVQSAPQNDGPTTTTEHKTQFNTQVAKHKFHEHVQILKTKSPLSTKSHSLLELPNPKEKPPTNSFDNLVKHSSFRRSHRNVLRIAKEASRRNLSRSVYKFNTGSPKIDATKLAVVVELHPGIHVESATSSRSSNEIETCSDKLTALRTTSLSKLSSSSLAVPSVIFELNTARPALSLTSLRSQLSTTSLASHANSMTSLSLPATTFVIPQLQKSSTPPPHQTEDDNKHRSLSVNFSLRPSSSSVTVGSANCHISSSASSVPSSPEVDCNRTTAMLVAVVLTFVATELPPGVIALWSGFDSKVFDDIYVPLGDVWDILVLVNSSVNFVLYCTMSRQFRRTFSKMFTTTKSNILSCLRPQQLIIDKKHYYYNSR